MISIVLPVYNGAAFLREAIESVRSQTDENWELILVDDASRDETPAIADVYAEADSRIRVIHNRTNRKLPGSLNTGFRQARGEYLTWTSDDNLYAPNALERMRDYLDRHPDCMMVVGGTVFFDGSREWRNRFDADRMFLANTVGGCFLYRREAYEEIGEYDCGKFLVEDYDYWLRMLVRYGSIGSLEEDLFRFRRHPTSLTCSRTQEILLRVDQLRIEYLAYLLRNFAEEPRVLTAVYAGFLRHGLMTESIHRQFCGYVRELEGVTPLDCTARVIVYGAGNKGREAGRLLHGRIAAYVDTDPRKIGTKLDGIEVLPLEALPERAEGFGVLIAIGDERLYEMLCALSKQGVHQYSIIAEIEGRSTANREEKNR